MKQNLHLGAIHRLSRLADRTSDDDVGGRAGVVVCGHPHSPDVAGGNTTTTCQCASYDSSTIGKTSRPPVRPSVCLFLLYLLFPLLSCFSSPPSFHSTDVLPLFVLLLTSTSTTARLAGSSVRPSAHRQQRLDGLNNAVRSITTVSFRSMTELDVFTQRNALVDCFDSHNGT